MERKMKSGLLERDLTNMTGPRSIVKLLKGTGWTWERVRDTGKKDHRGSGFDGWLVKGALAVRTEVKLGSAKLTASERAKMQECQDAGQPYMILRFEEIEIVATIQNEKMFCAPEMQFVLHWIEEQLKNWGRP